MSDTTTERTPLSTIEAFEAGAFRVGQLARRLRTDHPDLPVVRMEPTAWALTSMFGDPDVTAELEIGAGTVDGVRAWAAALDVEATVTTSVNSPFELAQASAVVDGVTVKVEGTRALTGDEYAAWKAEHEKPAKGGAA